jgi:hypothetical protein
VTCAPPDVPNKATRRPQTIPRIVIADESYVDPC